MQSKTYNGLNILIFSRFMHEIVDNNYSVRLNDISLKIEKSADPNILKNAVLLQFYRKKLLLYVDLLSLLKKLMKSEQKYYG